MDREPFSAAALIKMGVAKSYAYQLFSGERTPGTGLALDIYHKHGVKLGALENASEDDIAALENLVAKGMVA